MRLQRLSALFALLLLLGLSAPVRADARSDCIARCSAVAEPCGRAARVTAAACTIEMRARCDKVAPAEKFRCLTTGQRPCSTTRNASGDACLAAFRSCHAACGPAAERQADFWCEVEVPGAAGGYAYAFCAGSAGQSGDDQARDCARRVARDLPGSAGLTCEQVN